jgi:hypothetical protein
MHPELMSRRTPQPDGEFDGYDDMWVPWCRFSNSNMLEFGSINDLEEADGFPGVLEHMLVEDLGELNQDLTGADASGPHDSNTGLSLDDNTAVSLMPSLLNQRTQSGRTLSFQSQEASILAPSSSCTSLSQPSDERNSAKRHCQSSLRVVQYDHTEKRKKPEWKRDQVRKSHVRAQKSRGLATRADVLRTDKV